MTVIAATAASADVLSADGECEPQYDAFVCPTVRVVEGAAIVVEPYGSSFSIDEGGQVQAAASALSADVLDEVAQNLAAYPPPVADTLPRGAWALPASCEDLGRRARLEEVMGPYGTGFWEGGPDGIRFRLSRAAGVGDVCGWIGDGPQQRIVTAGILPGGARDWEELAAAGAAVAVGGATAAVRTAGGESIITATDGVNVVYVDAGKDIDVGVIEALLRALGE